MERFLESIAARIDGPAAAGKNMTLNFVFTDLDESWVLTLENSVLHHRRSAPDPDASVTVRVTRELLLGLITGRAGVRDLVLGDELEIDGSRLDLLSFLSLVEAPDPAFAIVTP
jgi:alkyl sulfatase BDS1-like metallo-beta-lactamase superfamily hydrolase